WTSSSPRHGSSGERRRQADVSAERADPMRLMEECAGVGEVEWRDRAFPGIRYRVRRYQGFAPSGLPVPGVHRLEGRLDLADVEERQAMVGTALTLRLEDGRTVRLTCTDPDGRVL